MEPNELLQILDDLVKYGVSHGANEIDAYGVISSEISVELEMGEIKSANELIDSGISIRAIVNNKIGTSFTSRFDKQSAYSAVDLAIKSAKSSTTNNKWRGLPSPREIAKLEGLWNPKFESTPVEKYVEMTGDLAKSIVAKDQSIIVGGAGTGVNTQIAAFANSNGIRFSGKGGIVYSYAMSVAPIKNGMTPGIFDVDITRDPDQINLNKITDTIVKDIQIAKNVVKGKSGTPEVIIAPRALGLLFMFTIFPMLSGENVLRGKSPLKERIGEQIASEKLTLYDDGLNPLGINTRPFDGEGIPQQKTPLISDGVLQQFIWSDYWAKQAGEESTGNASRDLRTGLISTKMTNPTIETGSSSLDNMISEIKYGYLIKGFQGAHSSNPESGDFSVVCNPVFLIENGEVKGSVFGLMMADNVFNILKNIVEIENKYTYDLTIISPHIKVKGLNIIAKE